jgi:hypothetical protein
MINLNTSPPTVEEERKHEKNAIYNISFEVELGASSKREAKQALNKWIKDSGGLDKFVRYERRKI